MEAAAASASRVSAKEAALAASVAAAAAAKEAAVAAATAAKEAAVEASAAAVKANEAAATASAAALNAKEAADVAAAAGEAAAAAAAAVAAAMQASKKRKFAAVPLNAEEAEPVAATAGKAAAAAATMQASKEPNFVAMALHSEEEAPVAATAMAALQASKKRKFHTTDVHQDPPGSGDVDDALSIDLIGQLPGVDDAESIDLISRLPDAVLCSIISLLHTKDGARTQSISRRWRSLWRSAPLNLVADHELKSKDHKFVDLISEVLSVHPGPARRFSLCLSISSCHGKIEEWFSSQALDKLQELELIPDRWFNVRDKLYLLPSSVYRFAPTLLVAKFSGCHFTNLIVKPSLKFPSLKQLTLDRVTISEDALQSMLSGCYALESLELKKNSGFGRLCISSQTLKSIGFCTNWITEGVPLRELVIKDAPCLERLLPLIPQVGPATIRVISAPKLNIVGVLSERIAELQFGTTVFQKLIAVGLTTKVHSVRVLVLDTDGPNLDTVVNFLKCFPCLERLYVTFPSRIGIYDAQKYDPLDPIECLELHLKEVVLKNYEGNRNLCIDLAKFFVLNAKVLQEMKITLPYHRQYNYFENQQWLLQTRDRASRNARIELKCGTPAYLTHNENTHDLSMADPFDVPSSGCSKCSRSPF